jgi:hypothetical protein
MSEKKKFPTLKYTWTQPLTHNDGYAWMDNLDESDAIMIWLDMIEFELEKGNSTAVDMLENIGIKC